MSSEHVDVLIVGAGLSGIGAACHIRTEVPEKSFAILEARDAIGGTWDLFRYPGIRSDSDMFTLGYSFKPWEAAKAIADGPDILSYVEEAAREYAIDREIRFGHKVVSAEWSSQDARWTVEAEHDGERVTLTCAFLFSCSGYYRYDEGYTPEFEGIERFGGQIVHPQHWPEDLDYEGKRVVVIGSGATAVTLVPAMARDTEHITMLQRSPSYVLALPGHDPVADLMRKILPRKAAYAAIRWKNVLLTIGTYQLSRRAPKFVRAALRKFAQLQLPKGYDVDTHFNPRYDPWDQRLCIVPSGDLFRSIKRGSASVVTDRIETFTENGIALESGAELEADIVITATGLNVQALGGIELTVDGRSFEPSDTVGYKGIMFSGVPNFALAIGYTNASWTLKCDLACQYVCRLLRHMDERGYAQVTPVWREDELPDRPFIDLQSGYVQRAIDQFPKQGDDAPWRLYQNYMRDVPMFKRGEIEDGALEFDAARLNSMALGTFARRVLGAVRRDGVRGVLLAELGRTLYRRVILIERDLTGEIAPVPCDVPFRLATLRPEDAGAYARYRPDRSPERVVERLRRGSVCYVAWQDDRIISGTWYHAGEAWIEDIQRRFELPPDERYSYDAHTSPELRGHGVTPARAAMVLTELRANGITRAVAFVLPKNAAGQRSRVKSGWRTFGSAGYLRLGLARVDFMKTTGNATRWRVRWTRLRRPPKAIPPALEPALLSEVTPGAPPLSRSR